MTLDHSYFEEMEAKIPHGKVRTRFAPSPTGYMHVGNLRTALYTWLIARSHGGTFILRIEDTDQTRQVEGAVDVIYRTMAECGLTHDEGPDVGGPVAPYIQSQRRDTYGKYAQLLVEKGAAYYCFCEKAESEEDSGDFDRAADPCRDLPLEEALRRVEAGEPYVIRQKIPSDGTTTFRAETAAGDRHTIRKRHVGSINHTDRQCDGSCNRARIHAKLVAMPLFNGHRAIPGMRAAGGISKVLKTGMVAIDGEGDTDVSAVLM